MWRHSSSSLASEFMSEMSVQSSLQFGVEIELLLGSRKRAHSSWKGMAKDLSKRLAMAGISNHVNEGNDKSQEQYAQWSIVQEVTIPSQPAKGLCKYKTLPTRLQNRPGHLIN